MLSDPVAPQERDWQEIAHSDRSGIESLAGYVPGGGDLLRFAGTHAGGCRAATWLAGGDAQGKIDAGPFDPRQAVDATGCGALGRNIGGRVVAKSGLGRRAGRARVIDGESRRPLAATSSVSTSAGAKTAALVKGAVKSLYVGKAAVAATAGGVTLAAVLAVTPPKKPAVEPPPPITSTTGLPPVVEQALRENARQLTPITVACTAQMSSQLPPIETFDRLKLNPFSRSDRFFSAIHGRIIWQDNKLYSSVKSPIGSAGDKQATAQSDILYDGVSRVMLRGSYYVPSKEFLDQQKRNGATVRPCDPQSHKGAARDYGRETVGRPRRR